jgi:hypothetical protein
MSLIHDFFLPAVGLSAAAAVTAISVLQTDVASRKLLSPARLQAKRNQEYSYRWKICMEKTHLQQAYYLAGGRDNYNAEPKNLAMNTEYFSKEEELKEFLGKILNSKSESRFRILKIDLDPDDPRGEYYLYLLEEHPSQRRQVYQVPLVTFGLALQTAFEDQLTTITLCFVADASSGKASKLLELLVKESKTGVAVLAEPLWMTTLASLVDQRLLAKPKVEQILFGLCRLEAWRLRDEAKESRTVLITLPGQATTPILLPLVQKAFADDRHVFCYDGCVASVERGIVSQRNYSRSALESTLDGVTSLAHNPVRHTTPLSRTSSTTRSVRGLREALAKVPVERAQVVETWMTSVDAFLKLKQEENINGYMPYVMKLALLTEPTDATFTPECDSYWSLCSLLQYVTGCRSRPLPEGVVDAAREWLKDYNEIKEPSLGFSPFEANAMENCVFKHKSILIGDKTLQDTVLPRQHWTLKQAGKKGGCACCAPEEDSDEEEGTQDNGSATAAGGGIDKGMPGAFVASTSTKSKATRPAFVDGKLGFAFDPTKFS